MFSDAVVVSFSVVKVVLQRRSGLCANDLIKQPTPKTNNNNAVVVSTSERRAKAFIRRKEGHLSLETVQTKTPKLK